MSCVCPRVEAEANRAVPEAKEQAATTPPKGHVAAKRSELDFAVERIQVVQLDIARKPDGLLAGHDLMSPYVWEAEGRINLLARVLENPLGPDAPTGVIYSATSDDGLFFTTEAQPAIEPGPDEVDAGGVEDPTVVIG